jgi:hypothetical protein
MEPGLTSAEEAAEVDDLDEVVVVEDEVEDRFAGPAGEVMFALVSLVCHSRDLSDFIWFALQI